MIKFSTVFFGLLMLIASFSVTAQSSKEYKPNIPDYSNNKPMVNPVPSTPPLPPNPIPIDGGILFLAAAGLGYGIRNTVHKLRS